MLKRTAILFFIIIVATQLAPAQEIQARFTVLAGQISTEVDKKIFQTLQTAVTNFINNRKWTTDDFQPNEKIQCNFLLNVEKDLGNSLYQGTLTVQAARPIHSTSYDSPIINVLDKDVVFRYQEFQPVEFNENRVQGNDPSAANLPAILAYYVNIILGFDYGSFSLRGGDNYFKKAWNIVSNAPESSNITGWRAFEDIRNRYWLAENLTNNRFTLIHDALYTYYRLGLDRFYENEAEAREGVANCLNFLNTVNTENPNSMIMQFFFQGKSNELVKIFSKADSDTKKRIREILSKLDITNSTAYKELK
ncbi:MAG TPA: DUF4835 family protein [Chitinophagaceae bacterium]|nr:DUF4835 family protein [Chitinophagaceae bacterium]